MLSHLHTIDFDGRLHRARLKGGAHFPLEAAALVKATWASTLPAQAQHPANEDPSCSSHCE